MLRKNDGPSEEIQNRLKHLDALIDLTALVNSSLDIDEIKQKAIESVIDLTNSEAGSLIFVDKHTHELYFDVASGEKGETVKTIRLKKGQGIAGWVAENHLPLIIEDAQGDHRFFRVADEISGFVTRNMICVPVETKNSLIGVLQVINRRDGKFDSKDMVMMVAFSHQVAISVENARLNEELKETFYDTIQAFAETIEMRDPYTGGHTKRVMEYSLAIGKRMGLPRSEREKLKLSAILHDIGKIGVMDEVLLKPGKLTPEEFKHMMRHAEIGPEVLSRIRRLKDILPGIKHHHERYDGNGYPSGLKGDDIPIIARIIAVADSFDAMTSDRPYRKGLSLEAGLEEVKRNSGTQFDPSAVKAFLAVYQTL